MNEQVTCVFALTRAHSCLSAAVVRQGAYGQYAKLSAYMGGEDDSE